MNKNKSTYCLINIAAIQLWGNFKLKSSHEDHFMSTINVRVGCSSGLTRLDPLCESIKRYSFGKFSKKKKNLP